MDMIVFEDTVATCMGDAGVTHQGVWRPGTTDLIRRCDGTHVRGQDVVKREQITTCLLCLAWDRSSKRFEVHFELEE